MQVVKEDIPDINRYINKYEFDDLQRKKKDFDPIVSWIKKYYDLTSESRILEIGCGTGWLQIIANKEGIICDGIEISQQLVKFAEDLASKNNAKVNIKLANIEETDLKSEHYDVVIANTTFEHVQKWRQGLKNIYKTLKKGGILYFYSTNKFAVKQSEADFPLYSYFPNKIRYKLRVMLQEPEIMKLGIDYNQFTYPLLRKEFNKIGFSEILDRVDLLSLEGKTGTKKMIVTMLKKSKALKSLYLTFCSGTFFICRK